LQCVQEDESALTSYEPFYADELERFLRRMRDFYALVVCMQQCSSGGFKEAVMRGTRARFTSFTAAAGPTTPTYGDTYRFTYFSETWMVALSGSGDRNGDGRVSPSEAFDCVNVLTLGEGAAVSFSDRRADMECVLGAV
jgi:hypothetical protein